jgi:hypothetical protein
MVEKLETLCHAPSAKCSVTLLNSAFVFVAGLDFGVS